MKSNEKGKDGSQKNRKEKSSESKLKEEQKAIDDVRGNINTMLEDMRAKDIISWQERDRLKNVVSFRIWDLSQIKNLHAQLKKCYKKVA